MLATLVNSSTGFTIGLADSPLMERAQDFYKNLVGLELKVDEANRKVLVSEDSRFSLTLRLSKDAPTQSQIDELKRQLDCTLKSTDWRSLASHISLKTPQLNDLIQSLRSSGHSVELFPNELFPTEAYTLDPVGNLIGFTCGQNAMTLKPSSAILDKKVSAPAPDSLAMSTSPSSQNSSNSTLRNIAVMTSGGDAPGMNACVRAVVRTAIFKGCNAYAVMEGYEGLVRGGSDHIKRMMWQDVECYLADGGTNIGTARCMAFRERLGRLKACKHMIEAGIDVLIVCGGDGSLTGADLFRSEWPSLIKELSNNNEISQTQYERHKHLNICGTVGSIDNDMATTDATIGAYSSLDRICKAIDYIGATAKSHSRAFVVEVMGRHCGWLALMAGIACSADYIFIPEKPAIAKDWQQQMCDVVSKHRAQGKRKTIVIVAEGAITNDLAHISAKEVKDVLVGRLGLDTRVTTLGHVQRGGTAVAFDRILATLQGVEAVNAVLESTPSTPSPLIGIEENQIVRLSLVDAVRITKSVADAIDRHDFEGAMALRDADFTEHLLNFMSMNSAIHEEPTLPVEKRKRIAIINVGAPAGGMNSAIYSMATFCMSRGHVPYAIHNGFSGLARHESVRSIDWLAIQGWTSMGGSEIGTNRATPEETDIGMIAYYFEKYKFDGLILVGGFEAFTSLHQLESARAMYPSFRIPMVLIPATISNNVPGTDYSLGADTCLNSLMNYCDIFKQSASATRNRAFVIEVQGGNSGYIATYASLACGALASYVPEEGIDLAQLELDVQAVRKSFSSPDDLGNSGTLILKSTNASKLLTTQVLADIFKQEGKHEFDTKTAIPGHVQQGGLPSPIDRTRASRFAVKAVQFIETSCDVISSTRGVFDFPVESQELIETAAVLGVKRSHLKFTSIRQLYNYETEHGKRMPKTISWNKTRKICDRLVGRVRLESC
ncbi:6-phosphofructokinase [Metschnikowia bicuspidata]|uniref:ATP-dependent 6-phosphofructokinase n=1 Tax=Metschnikowia bicuspidata TaxID=27322 RepID=A0A4P9ZHC2_9ASCO|nr:6-phosphofructokinase [Metschnikowia bicuspidata]